MWFIRMQRTKNDGDDLNEGPLISDKCTLQKPGCSEFVDYDHVNAYLIFVIFFTLAKFLENKIYTEKHQFFALNL